MYIFYKSHNHTKQKEAAKNPYKNIDYLFLDKSVDKCKVALSIIITLIVKRRARAMIIMKSSSFSLFYKIQTFLLLLIWFIGIFATNVAWLLLSFNSTSMLLLSTSTYLLIT